MIQIFKKNPKQKDLQMKVRSMSVVHRATWSLGSEPAGHCSLFCSLYHGCFVQMSWSLCVALTCPKHCHSGGEVLKYAFPSCQSPSLHSHHLGTFSGCYFRSGPDRVVPSWQVTELVLEFSLWIILYASVFWMQLLYLFPLHLITLTKKVVRCFYTELY